MRLYFLTVSPSIQLSRQRQASVSPWSHYYSWPAGLCVVYVSSFIPDTSLDKRRSPVMDSSNADPVPFLGFFSMFSIAPR
jgi:hypothetical protein